jgi:hypothetical protein
MGKDPDFLGLGGYNSSGSGAVCSMDVQDSISFRSIIPVSINVGGALQMLQAQKHPIQGQMTAGKPPRAAYARFDQTHEYCAHALDPVCLCSCSVDSAELRAAEAEARLRDFGATTSQQKPTGLPSALDAFSEVGKAAACLIPQLGVGGRRAAGALGNS